MLEPTNRQPIYADQRDKRVVSAPAGQWIAQKQLTPKGTRENSNWEDISRPTNWWDASARAGVK